MGIVVHSATRRKIKDPIFIGVDVGGTNIRSAGYYNSEGRLKRIFRRENKTADFNSLNEAVECLRRMPGVDARFWQDVAGVSFGIAGAFDGHKVKITNRQEWKEIDLQEIAEEFGFPNVGGVNDLEATAYGIVAGLDNEEVITIHPGVKKPGNQAVIAPGTGLGEGIIIEGKYPVASEGGHSDFAPIGELQRELAAYLEKKYPDGSICYEDVLSGYGLLNIMDFFIEEKGFEAPYGYSEAVDINEKIGSMFSGLSKNNPGAKEALIMYFKILAAEASNLAVKSLSTGGLYLGGTTRKDIPTLKLFNDMFVNAFINKRKQRQLLSQIPVQVIKKDDVNEYGAAYFVSRKMSK